MKKVAVHKIVADNYNAVSARVGTTGRVEDGDLEVIQGHIDMFLMAWRRTFKSVTVKVSLLDFRAKRIFRTISVVYRIS